jgi:hypothetical protein
MSSFDVTLKMFDVKYQNDEFIYQDNQLNNDREENEWKGIIIIMKF